VNAAHSIQHFVVAAYPLVLSLGGNLAGLTAFLKVTYDLRKARRELESLKKKEDSRITTEPVSTEEIHALYRKERLLKRTRGLFLVVTASLVISLVSATLAIPTFSHTLNELETSSEKIDDLGAKLAAAQQQLSGAQAQVMVLQGQLEECQNQAQVVQQEPGASRNDGSENGSDQGNNGRVSPSPLGTEHKSMFSYLFEPRDYDSWLFENKDTVYFAHHKGRDYRFAGSLVCDAIAKVYGGLSAHEKGDFYGESKDVSAAERLLSDAADVYSDLAGSWGDESDIQNVLKPDVISSMAQRLSSLGVEIPSSHSSLAKLAASEVHRLLNVLNEGEFTGPEEALRFQEALSRIHYVGIAISFVMKYSSQRLT
jgi:hypothetical protein